MVGWRKGLAASLIPLFVGLASPKDISSGTGVSYDNSKLENEVKTESFFNGSEGLDRKFKIVSSEDYKGRPSSINALMGKDFGGERDTLTAFNYSANYEKGNAVVGIVNNQGVFELDEKNSYDYAGLNDKRVEEKYSVHWGSEKDIINYSAKIYSGEKLFDAFGCKGLTHEQLADKQAEEFSKSLDISEQKLQEKFENRNKSISHLPYSENLSGEVKDFLKGEQPYLFGEVSVK